MLHEHDTLRILNSVSPSEFATVSGGQSKLAGWWKVLGSGKSVDTGPSTVMEILDNPPRALESLGHTLGVPPTGRPWETYQPATANPDGTINRGGFGSPPSPIQVPQRQ